MFIYCHEQRTPQKTDVKHQTEGYCKMEGDIALCLILLGVHDLLCLENYIYILQMCATNHKNIVDGN